MDISLLLWIVIGVVFYTAISMYLSSKKNANPEAPSQEAAQL